MRVLWAGETACAKYRGTKSTALLRSGGNCARWDYWGLERWKRMGPTPLTILNGRPGEEKCKNSKIEVRISHQQSSLDRDWREGG